MGSAGECSQEQLDARFRDNDFTLPPCVLDLLQDGLERADYVVAPDDLEDPYYGPDRKVTRADKVVENERTRKVAETLYLVHVPASVLCEAQLETIGYLLHLLHVLASKLRRARKEEREADGYQEGISKQEGPGFRVLVFSFELNQEIDRAFVAMFHDVDAWAGPKFPIQFVPWERIRVLRDQNEKDQDRQVKFILENYALPTSRE